VPGSSQEALSLHLSKVRLQWCQNPSHRRRRSDLPTDFLSTPFGAALRPTIDAMYSRPTPGAPAVAPPPPNQPVAASLLQAVAAQAQASSSTPSLPAAPLAATESLAGPIHPSTNSASFRNLLRTHRAVVAFFTDYQGCPPCRMIAPVFEQLAADKGVRAAAGGRGAAFTKIDLRVGAGGTLATEWGVRVTPTFMFFFDGTKVRRLHDGKKIICNPVFADCGDQGCRCWRTEDADRSVVIPGLSGYVFCPLRR
jgi:thiol-disulfide isomerase/thioredoxin